MADTELSNDAHIIRFGIMALHDVKRTLRDTKDDPDSGQWELSFFGGNGLSDAEIANIAEAPNPKMRISRVGLLRQGGFEPFLQEPPPGHIGLRWEQEPTDEELKVLIGLFDEPVENPHPRM